MNVVGYLDRLSVPAGGRVACMASSTADEVNVDVVRLIHGDTNPDGPGFKVEVVDCIEATTAPGKTQYIYPGSCMVAGGVVLGAPVLALQLTALIKPTTPSLGQPQGVITLVGADGGANVSVVLTELGHLAVDVGPPGNSERIADNGRPLFEHRWYMVSLSIDVDGGAVALTQHPVHRIPGDATDLTASGNWSLPLPPQVDVVVAALACRRAGRQWRPEGVFNGKIENPRIALAVASDSGAREWTTVADWRFELGVDGCAARDVSGRGHEGRFVNSPMRAATGSLWTGRVLNHREAPEQYGAVHFHDDDIDDAAWEPITHLDIPATVPSGVYAVRLQAGGEVDHIPFAITAGPGQPRQRIAVLIPTFTYLAYANERLLHRLDYEKEGITDHPITPWPHDEELSKHPEYGLSLYDTHTDGSGCCYSSSLRPILNLRPDYRMWLQNAPRHLSADLYLVDWLEHGDYTYEVLTDHDLHEQGAGALSPYDVVITGSHPEYYSEQMLDALQAHLDSGGSLMYLGGNGFYWVTSQAADRPHLIEVRRGNAGTRTWEIKPGEGYHSTTGEPGGLWRHRGRSPNALVGVGMCSQGWDEKAPGYRRMPDSFSARAAFVFEGVGPDEIIGDFGLIMKGASGDELDRYDPAYGSPPHTQVLARSTGHSDYYQLAGEDVLMTRPGLGGSTCDLVRSDMVLIEQSSGGAVFSVGSICFTGALSHNNYENNVSTIVGNVLSNFSSRKAKTSHQR